MITITEIKSAITHTLNVIQTNDNYYTVEENSSRNTEILPSGRYEYISMQITIKERSKRDNSIVSIVANFDNTINIPHDDVFPVLNHFYYTAYISIYNLLLTYLSKNK